MSALPGFGALILTHGRPDRVQTAPALHRFGYTGPWWLVVDEQDPTLSDYRAMHGQGRVVTFRKDDAAQDMGDNGGSRGVILYARNAADQLAASLGLTHYVQLDDDYNHWEHKFLAPDGGLGWAYVRDLDAVFAALVEFLDGSGALTVAMAQGGDMIGGSAGAWRQGLKRKAMNTFVCRVGSPVGFVGRLNEDVNTYVWRGSTGALFLTCLGLTVDQASTQTVQGGMAEAYLAAGTYRKSFYTVMWGPSAAQVSVMGENHTRIHHRVTWDHAVPKILSDRWRKPRPA